MKTEKMSFRKTSFEEILNYFKLINGWLNSKLCAERKLLHSDENAYVFFVKKKTLKFVIDLLKLDALGNFVPLYFPLNLTSQFYYCSSPELY